MLPVLETERLYLKPRTEADLDFVAALNADPEVMRFIAAVGDPAMGREGVAARSFLHNQIRSFAGTLRLVGEAKWSADDVEAALLARSRKACGPVAPPEGLCFRAVEYPLS